MGLTTLYRLGRRQGLADPRQPPQDDQLSTSEFTDTAHVTGRRRFGRRGAEGSIAHAASASDSAPLLLETPARRAVVRRDRAFRWALLGADVVAALIVVLICAVTLGASGPSLDGVWLALLVPAVNAAAGLYGRDERLINKTTLDEAPTLFQAATLSTLLAFMLESAILHQPIGATVAAVTWGGLTVVVPACRVAGRAIARNAMPPERCLVVGDQEQARRIAGKLTEYAGVKAEVVRIMPLASGPGGRSMLERLARAVDERDVDRIVIVPHVAAPQQELEAVQAAKALGVKVSVLPRVLEVVGSSASYDYVDGLTVLGVPRFGLSRPAGMLKRALDIAAATIALVILAPLMAVVAIAVKLTSDGPVLFRQTRIGRGGEPFAMLKFRSMYADAEARKAQLLDRNEADGLFKIADDPRITRAGRYLRPTSLDELPQLFNVLRGEMSLVGPRPLVPEEDSKIQGWHRRRLHLTPGMTGPWQVLGSARIPLREMVTIDYLYVGNWSLWGDVKILLRTIAAVVERRGS
jgi:exopolysaccharide biosynthesis polyprenyl glycosylphosphotransferase